MSLLANGPVCVYEGKYYSMNKSVKEGKKTTQDLFLLGIEVNDPEEIKDKVLCLSPGYLRKEHLSISPKGNTISSFQSCLLFQPVYL
jgi:hypothetical protein